MLAWQYKCAVFIIIHTTKVSDIVHGILIPTRNIWNSGIMNYAWVLGNYVSALEAVGSCEWKKSATENFNQHEATVLKNVAYDFQRQARQLMHAAVLEGDQEWE